VSPPTLAIGEHVSHAQTEQRVIVRFVSWTTYEHLLADLSNQSSTRLTYDRGMLEIMCPLPEREEWNRTIALLVEVLAEEMRIDVRNFGSTTFRRADLARGFEPDSCFYIQHEADISGKSTIDLTVDPPPDKSSPTIFAYPSEH
jgi:Uma2 family endonuclease